MDLECCFVQDGPELVLPKKPEELYLDRERALQRERETHNQAIEKLQLQEIENDPCVVDRDSKRRQKTQEELVELQIEKKQLLRSINFHAVIQNQILAQTQETLTLQQQQSLLGSMRYRLCGELIMSLITEIESEKSELATERSALVSRVDKAIQSYEQSLSLQRHEGYALIKSRLLQSHNIKKQVDILDDEEDDCMRRGQSMPYVKRDRLQSLKDKLSNVEKDIESRRKRLADDEQAAVGSIATRKAGLSVEIKSLEDVSFQADFQLRSLNLALLNGHSKGTFRLPETLLTYLQELKLDDIDSSIDSSCASASTNNPIAKIKPKLKHAGPDEAEIQALGKIIQQYRDLIRHLSTAILNAQATRRRRRSLQLVSISLNKRSNQQREARDKAVAAEEVCSRKTQTVAESKGFQSDSHDLKLFLKQINQEWLPGDSSNISNFSDISGSALSSASAYNAARSRVRSPGRDKSMISNPDRSEFGQSTLSMFESDEEDEKDVSNISNRSIDREPPAVASKAESPDN